ncbi:carbohydrate ABC transporter substrate-binding protein (CUT1 family) [Lacrimispora xylanisolvens]|uniref:Carbohydrate ABC transporter substrate-binding protein (CUT1 family) n=1 Tax=Lacrimispora xylanisolvens TaxID=384636 RepID=A0A2S6HXF1_9FIRM|nr:extracellular solute-binding protein [Hungatella xylanolytica]PPK82593.1 carbohydrate ABC transporter substrate-binding protein (CUT1 family) [Hungatella xylanolytica]
MKKRQIGMLLCAAAAAIALAGCGSGKTKTEDTKAGQESSKETGKESSQAAAGGDVVIKVFSNLPDRTSGQGLIEQMLFDQYMEKNPNVKIQVEALDDESYKTKFKAYASGSDMPDLVNAWGQPSFLDEVIDAGLLAELNPADYKDYGFIQGALDGFSKDGKLYGLARNTDVMAFYYNKSMFEKYGVKVPETYDDLLAAVNTFKAAGVIPVSMDGSDKWPLSIYINALYQQYNGSSSSKEIREAVKTGDYSNEAWTKSLDQLKKSIDAGIFQTGFETTDYATSMNLFTNGQAAMYYMGSWEMSMATNENIPEEIRNNIGVFNMPAVEGGKGTKTDLTAWNGGGHAVTANSKVKAEAIKLLNYMYQPENWSKLCWEKGVCMSAQNFSQYLTGKETALQLEFVDKVNHATSISGVTFNDLGTNQFKTVSEDASVEFAIGQLTAKDFTDKLAGAMKK